MSGALSGSVPRSNSESMECGTVGKYSLPMLVSSSMPRNTTAKRKMKMNSKANVKATERRATNIPLMRTINSGIARRSRTTRAMRVSFTIRKSFKTVGSTKEVPPVADDMLSTPVIHSTNVSTPVSRIITTTKKLSNTNHASLKQSGLCLKATNLTIISAVKNAQKRNSATWKTQCALRMFLWSFMSRSKAIQKALKKITARVIESKPWDRAIHCPQPDSWYKVRTSYSLFMTASRTLAFILSASAKTARPFFVVARVVFVSSSSS
mmetsp:Transcript_79501/g.184491  ORF Transcript_79501/g.184491 Transcript_79501/m.184491 type:complete len:266 (+) Transcript_79501:742-1539(+)